MSVYCDWVRWKVWSATSISVWQHVHLSEQIRPSDTLECCWDIKQASKQPTNKCLASSPLVVSISVQCMDFSSRSSVGHGPAFSKVFVHTACKCTAFRTFSALSWRQALASDLDHCCYKCERMIGILSTPIIMFQCLLRLERTFSTFYSFSFLLAFFLFLFFFFKCL